MKKKIIFRILILLVLIIIVLLMLLPGIAKRYVVNHSDELAGRHIDIHKLKLNYFTTTVKVIDFKMFEANKKDVFVSFDTLILNLQPLNLFKDELVIEKFYLMGLETSIVQLDSTFNFDDLIAYHIIEEDSTLIDADTVASDSYNYSFSNLELRDARVLYTDANIGETIKTNDLDLFIPYIGFDQEYASQSGLKFDFENGGYFESVFHVDPNAGDFDARIMIQKLYLNGFAEFANQYMNISSLGGQLYTDLFIEGNIYEADKSLMSGTFEVDDFEMWDDSLRKFLGAEKLECLVKNIDYHNSSYIIDSVEITKPYVYFELMDSTNNFFEVLNYAYFESDSISDMEPLSDTVMIEESGELYYAINAIIIKDGIIDYRDNLTGEPFDYHLSEMEVETDSLESTSEWVDMYANMLLNNRGLLKAEVGFNPLDPMDIKLDFVVTDFQLPDLNIYTNFYIGHFIVEGDMYYKSATNILGGIIESENKLVIENAMIDKDSVSGLQIIPLKFALFILKDKDGIINLDVPVTGDLNDPDVNIGKLVWTTFKNLIIKVATAPGRFFSNMLGANPEDMESIEFAFADTTLTDYHKKQLGLLLELEQKKEELKIELVYFIDVEKEKEQIAYQETSKLFQKKSGKLPEQNKVGFENFVKQKSNADTLNLIDACIVIATPELVDELYTQFQTYRIERITNYLMLQNEMTKITASMAEANDPDNLGSKPIFILEYSLD